MIMPKLNRTAYVDQSLLDNVSLSQNDITHSKKPFVDGAAEQYERNARRGLLKAVVMVEKAVDDNQKPLKGKPFVVAGVGINISRPDVPDYTKYIDNTGLNKKKVTEDMEAIYYNMMKAAATNGAKGFVCPYLSSSYYAGKTEPYAGDMKAASIAAYNTAQARVKKEFPGCEVVLETKNSVNRVKQLAASLKCDESEIAVGIAGADNSGTGNLAKAHQKPQSTSLPQEESVRYGLGSPFSDLSNYDTVNNYVYPNGNLSPATNSIKPDATATNAAGMGQQSKWAAVRDQSNSAHASPNPVFERSSTSCAGTLEETTHYLNNGKVLMGDNGQKTMLEMWVEADPRKISHQQLEQAADLLATSAVKGVMGNLKNNCMVDMVPNIRAGHTKHAEQAMKVTFDSPEEASAFSKNLHRYGVHSLTFGKNHAKTAQRDANGKYAIYLTKEDLATISVVTNIVTQPGAGSKAFDIKVEVFNQKKQSQNATARQEGMMQPISDGEELNTQTPRPGG